MSDEWLDEEADFERLMALNDEERTEKANLLALPKTPQSTLFSQPPPRSRGWRGRRQHRSRSPSLSFSDARILSGLDDERSRSSHTQSPCVVPKTPSRSVSPIAPRNDDLKRACEPTSSSVNDPSGLSEPPLPWLDSAAKWKPPLTASSQPLPQMPAKPKLLLFARKESSQPPPPIHLIVRKEPSSPPPANLLHAALDAVGVPRLIAKPPSQSLCRRTNKDGNPRPRGGGKNKSNRMLYVPPRRQPNVVWSTHQPLVVPPKRQPHVVPPTKPVVGVWV
jgi:hypothetical protein